MVLAQMHQPDTIITTLITVSYHTTELCSLYRAELPYGTRSLLSSYLESNQASHVENNNVIDRNVLCM